MSDLPVSVRALKAHIAINVADVPRSLEFYRKVFGMEPVKVRQGYAKFDVAAQPLQTSCSVYRSSPCLGTTAAGRRRCVASLSRHSASHL